ncbi:3-hydroxyacyl-CoA dehydrogenase NAD-binding domain-containing protein [Sporosarcina luteola]|uniref:3-hydroxyacyl-CoA dehydrogenase family protein n=1 Tax=Sporosarcina luteola TaxID=582850 RepID=UPI00203F0C26|nr:3-hydroxyacyl-CoA dehydrogenase NAD-binding domain-containing protein [Sporosarcina luteola]MCM3636550.1 3-hydroxyacyl-CoA dehydrogenase NAD-binding domain-containing protein [Sporosarcina luteola]
MKSVAIVGAGQMGSGIAQCMAMNNIEVTLIDYKESNIKRASANIKKSLDKLVLKRKIDKESVLKIHSNIVYTTSLEACSRKEKVIETIPESLDKKENFIAKLSEIMRKDSILGTNTSSLSITKFSSFLMILLE